MTVRVILKKQRAILRRNPLAGQRRQRKEQAEKANGQQWNWMISSASLSTMKALKGS